MQAWATSTFSFFSHAFWPIFVPFAILLVETGRRRRQALQAFVGLGLVVGLYLLFFLFREPLTASVQGRSIVYDSPHFYLGAVLVLYLLATCVSGLLSSHRCINIFGVLALRPGGRRLPRLREDLRLGVVLLRCGAERAHPHPLQRLDACRPAGGRTTRHAGPGVTPGEEVGR